MEGLVLRSVRDGVGVALSPRPVVAASGRRGTRRPRTNALGVVAGGVIHRAVVRAVLVAAGRGHGQCGGAAPTRPLAVALRALGVAPVVGAVATWRGRPASAGPLRRWRGRMDQRAPRTAFLAAFLAVSLDARNLALARTPRHKIL